MDDDTEPALVLVIDDNDAGEEWDARFAANARQREPGARTFQLYGDVCTTPQAGRAAVLHAFNEQQRTGEQLLPDIVVIDHVLATGGVNNRREPASLELVAALREMTGDDLPPCVLWSGKYEPGLAYAFCERGGAHAFDRTVPAAEFVTALWDVLVGARWSHQPSPPRLKVTPDILEALPYFEAELPTHEIAAGLTQDLGRRVTDTQVHDRLRALRIRVNALLEELGEPTLDGRGQSGRLARFASEQGVVWLPLAYRPGGRA